jgi:hypothetical protein
VLDFFQDEREPTEAEGGTMHATHARIHVTGSQLAIAVALLVGVLVMGLGYFAQSKAGIYAGFVVIVGGVVFGVLELLMRGEE